MNISLFKENFKGFTLIELLVVIAIIGLLSSMSVYAINVARVKSRDARRMADLKQIATALELYYDDYGYYPKIIHALGYDTSCGSSPGCGHCDRWCLIDSLLEPYLKDVPREPLGDTTNYHYSYTSNPGNDWQSFGLYAILESSVSEAQEDGGYWPSRYELGPQVGYCMNKYTGTNRNWFDGKSPWDNVCAGGN